MQNDMSASATSKIPASEITTFHAPPPSSPAEARPRAGAAPEAPAVESAAATAAATVATGGMMPEYKGAELVIQPSKGWIGIDWPELFRFRELLYFLVWRDVKVRYKQAILGVGWAILVPILHMIVFTQIFGRAAKLGAELPASLPYSVFVFTGLVPWTLFAAALSAGGMSLVNQQNLLTKIYFPRLFVPTATVGSALVDMVLQWCVFAGLCAFTGFVPSWQVVFVPLLLVPVFVMALGASYLLSALTVTYRDFRFLIPVMVQIWMYLSFIPIPVPKDIRESDRWQALLALNPMYNFVAAIRKCITGVSEQVGYNPLYLAISTVLAIALFVLGLFYFRKTERRFADIA